MRASRADWIMRVPDIEPHSSLLIHPRDGLTRQEVFDAMVAMGYSVQGQIINGHARMGTFSVGEHGTTLYIRRYGGGLRRGVAITAGEQADARE
jgi:hypothetical protein